MSKTKLIACIVFIIILLASWLQAEGQERIIIKSPFNPVKTVYPPYPEILKKEGVAARVSLYISIDRKGNVTKAMIMNCLYPELEKSLLEALSQCKFEPFIHKGEPIRIVGPITIIFFPGELSPPAKKSESMTKAIEEELTFPLNKELQMVLDKCSEYCLKLSESALYYVCNEKINEKFKRIEEQEGIGLTLAGSPDLGPNEMMKIDDKILTLGSSEKHVYLYDYQLIRKQGHIEEKRVLVEEDGKNVNMEDVPRRTKAFYSFKPILAPIQFLSIEQRSNFFFKLADDEKINGKPAYVLEALLRPGQTGGIKRGKIWVDKADFRIAKAEVESDFIEGYDQILRECNYYYLKPHFKSTYYYEIDKNGLLFPSRSEIRVEYSGLLTKKKALKSDIEVTYENYKFFTVDINHEIIKKKIESLFSTRSRLALKYAIQSMPFILGHF